MQQQGFRSPQSPLTMDTKAANSPTFPTTITLAVLRLKGTDIQNLIFDNKLNYKLISILKKPYHECYLF